MQADDGATESGRTDPRLGRVARAGRWFGRHRSAGFGIVAVIVIAAIGAVALSRSDSGSGTTDGPAPLSENPVVSRYQQQLAVLAEQVEANPGDAKALRNYGVALYATGDVSRAREEYEAELKVNPSDAVLLNNLGNVYRDLGTYDKALDAYQKSISLDSGTATAFMNLANLYQYTLDQKDLGIKTLQTALVNLPDNQDLGVMLGIAFEQNGAAADGLAAFQQVLKQNPDNAAARAGVERLGG